MAIVSAVPSSALELHNFVISVVKRPNLSLKNELGPKLEFKAKKVKLSSAELKNENSANV